MKLLILRAAGDRVLMKGVSSLFIFKDKKENQKQGVQQKVFLFICLFNQEVEVEIDDLLSSLKFLCFSGSNAFLNIAWNIKDKIFTLNNRQLKSDINQIMTNSRTTKLGMHGCYTQKKSGIIWKQISFKNKFCLQMQP